MLVVNSLQHPKSFSLSKPLSHLGTMLRPVVVVLLLSLPKLWRLRPSLDDLVMDGEVGGESQLINRSFVDGGAAEVRRCDCCLALLKVKSRKGIAGAWDLTLFIFGGGGLGGPDFLRTSFTFWDDDLKNQTHTLNKILSPKTYLWPDDTITVKLVSSLYPTQFKENQITSRQCQFAWYWLWTN